MVLGGAGYVGSHFVWEATRQKNECFVFDDLSRGFSFLLHPDAKFFKARVQEQEKLTATILEFKPDVIINYAAFTYVDESVREPVLYFENNVGGIISLLGALNNCAIKNMRPALVFSSTCALYGQPEVVPIVETTPKNPLSPYGTSKLLCENIIETMCRYKNLKAICLRYFNAAGADESGKIGESHDPETHMIPNACQAVLKNQSLKIFGSDYKTPDGTCLRDYIHVTDLAQAHLLAARKLMEVKESYFQALNVGSGHGTSNLEIVQKLEKVAKKKISINFEERRPGDPDQLFSDTRKIKEELGFIAKYSAMENILQSAYNWHSKRPTI